MALYNPIAPAATVDPITPSALAGTATPYATTPTSIPIMPADGSTPTPFAPVTPVAQPAPVAPVTLSPQDQASLAQISGPVISRLPAAQASLQTKYASGAYDDLPAPVLAALQKIDVARVNSGSYPLSHDDTVLAAQAATTHKEATPEKKRSLWDVPGNAFTDLEGLVASVPRLPGALIHEVQQIPQLPEDIAKVRSIQDAAKLPIVNLIPGVHTLSDLSQGGAGLEDLVTHPLNTALDVLWPAEGLAELTPAAKLAEETAQANIAAGASPLENRVNPLTTAITKKVIDGENGPELANRMLGNAADAIRDTRAGQAFQAAFGVHARVDSKVLGEGNARLAFQAHDVNGDVPSQVSAASLNVGDLSGRELFDRYGMKKADAADVTTRLQLDPDSIATLPAGYQQYAQDYLDRRAALDQWVQENNVLNARTVNGNVELYNDQDAATIDRRKALYTTRANAVDKRFIDLVGKYAAPAGVTADGWRDMANQAIVSGGHVTDILDNPNIPTRPLPDRLAPVVDAYQAYLGGTGTAKDLNAEVSKLSLGRTNLGATSNTVGKSAVGEPGQPVTSLAEFGNFKTATKRLASAEDVANRSVIPARFVPKVREAAEQAYIGYKFTDPADIEQATQLAQQGMLKQMAGFSRESTLDPATGERVKGLLDFYSDAAKNWESFVPTDFNPVYVHSVSPQAAESTFFPKVTEVPRTPSQLKSRTLDMTPQYLDANVAIANEAVNILKQRVTQEVVDNLADLRAVPFETVRAEFATRAKAEALRDPTQTEDSHLDRLIRKKYQPYEPDQLFGNPAGVTTSRSPDTWISNVDAKVIKGAFQPKDYNIFSTVEPLTGVMRTSLLPLSPRWHLYNITGGAITGQAISSAKFLTRAPEAWGIVSKFMKGEDVSDLVPRELTEDLGGMKRDAAEMQFRTGRTLRRFVDQVRGLDPDLEQAAAEGANAGAPATGAANAVASGFGKVVAKSFDINQRFDDFYRVLGYLDGYDTSGAIDGMSEAGRIQYGLTQANSVLQDMTQLTPFEMNVMRPIFPFYTYYQHILRYALKYPIDHPLRLAITANIGRMEQDRLGGLPASFMDIFTWGKPDAQGNQHGINAGSINPFNDISNLFTLAGWLGATNPAVKTLIQSTGIDPSNGGPELYPTLEYDPTTGKLAAASGDPLENLVFNTLPQSQIIGNLLGQNADFSKLQRTDPEAAARLLRSEGGLPLIAGAYNLSSERIKTELNRQSAASTAKSADLKSGDLQDLSQYPSLTPVLARLAALQRSGQLANYQPSPATTPSTGSVALDAATGTIGLSEIPADRQGAYADQLATLQQKRAS